jgi:hypothetical protein
MFLTNLNGSDSDVMQRIAFLTQFGPGGHESCFRTSRRLAYIDILVFLQVVISESEPVLRPHHTKFSITC